MIDPREQFYWDDTCADCREELAEYLALKRLEEENDAGSSDQGGEGEGGSTPTPPF